MPRKYKQRTMRTITSILELDLVQPEPNSGCWLWAGNYTNGYGCFGYQKKHHRAHRLSWSLVNGEIPKGLWILHRCHNPWCVNPDHLYAGTPVQNTRDMLAAGREARQKGETSARSKLKEHQVKSAREMYANGARISDLWPQFGVTQACMWAIVHRKIWKHI